MKKILIILFAISPIFAIGQSQGDYLLKLNLGFTYDEKHERHDGDDPDYNADTYTSYGDDSSAKLGFQLSGGYFLIDDLALGLNWTHSKIL